MGVGHSRRGQAGVRDFYFILLIFLMWAIFKVFIEFVTILLFFFFFFGCEASEVLDPWPGIGRHPLHWKVKS